MRRLTTLILFAAVTLLLLAPARAQAPEPRVIMISVDGLMPSSYTSAAMEQYTPNLRKLAQRGIWADGVVGVLPSVTYPSHTTLITGVEPSVHGIYDNRIFDPENRSNGAWFWYARSIKVPTLPMAARARGLRAGAVTWPVTIGMDLDYLAPEYMGSDHEESVNMLRAISKPHTLIDAAEAARGKPFGWPQTDRDRTDLTTFILKTFDPHIMLLHLIELDDAQHQHGPGSPQALATLAGIDAQIGEIVEAVRSAGRGDHTHVAVVSDHGFLPLKTQLQPNAAFKQAGLLSVDASGAVTAWRAYFHSAGGSGYVYVKDPADESRVRWMLSELKSNTANGVREVWTRAELAARGSHPDATFGLDVVDGFYTGGGHDVLVKPSTSQGGHGFDPQRPALHASFVLAGPAVSRRGAVGVIRMTQIAPTLASILGVGLSPAAARGLEVTAKGSGTRESRP
jgi:predicted AlkP superfamily pyrophosphatase or phosphodiesterase